MTIDDIDNDSKFINSNHEEAIIKVVGVGGGGDNAVNNMFEQGIRKVSFVVCNTDRQALNNSPVQHRLLIGNGLGAGNKPEVARKAAEESADEISAIFDDDTRMVFITAGMGGGTGTGAGPVVARIAKERGLLTIGIVTIPFLFEGEKKIMKALDGAEEMSKYVDALLVVNNELLTEIYPDLDWVNAFKKADDTLTNAARSISELITCDGYINLDFNDVDTTLRNGGAAIISTGYGEGKNRVTKAIEDALRSPLLRNRDINNSKRLLFNLYFSRDAEEKFVMDEAKELTSFISNLNRDVDIIYGIGFDETLGNKIKITVLAAGFDMSIRADIKTASTISSPGVGTLFGENQGNDGGNAKEDLVHIYGGDKVREMEQKQLAQRYIVLTPDQFDDDDVIEKFEDTPSYNRDRSIVNNVRDTPAKGTAQPAAEKVTIAANQVNNEPKESDSTRKVIF